MTLDTITAESGYNASGSQVDLAYGMIEDMIVTMELAPGSRIAESALVSRLGIGRTPIREALLRLAADQLLTWLPRRGMVVPEINIQLQLKVFETRKALEMLLVPAAARRRTQAEAQAIAQIAAEFRRLLGSERNLELLRLDRRFIATLIEVSRNPFLHLIEPLYSLSRRFWLAHRDLYRTRFRDETLTEFHIRIADAVAEGDEEMALRHAKDFMNYVEEYTLYLGTELSLPERK